jgi:hypothetical protein
MERRTSCAGSRARRAAVKLKGEHVARVLDIGQLSNGVPFIVMGISRRRPQRGHQHHMQDP